MGKNNFHYDETGATYYYVFLTFLGLVLVPSTYYFWPFRSDRNEVDPEKKRKYLNAAAKNTIYWAACHEKEERIQRKDPWAKTKKVVAAVLLLAGWGLFFTVLYQISHFDYEMANFDPYEILEVGYDASAKEIKKKYREMSLKYHPDKPTGNEKLFMKLTKAYDALTDETAKYNWEHYGNPDGPQAMRFGIGLPAWIVEEENSIWVLAVYTLVFMICLPSAVYYWWSNSAKFSGESVLLDTTQLYYYFFHKTPHMMLKRVLMVLAASLEFERGHNSEVVERPMDNVEIPQLMKCIPNLGVNNKEKPLCYGYSVKARVLLFAHLSRIALPQDTLHQDRLFVIKKCPFLIHEMVQCISQLILLAHAGRIGRLPSLDTIEYAMKLSPMIVQALWDKSSPLLQLPHIVEDNLKHFYSRKRNIKTLHQLAKMKDDDRRLLLRSMDDDQYRDVIRVLSLLPLVEVDVTTEVVDDEEQHVVTAGAIVTVTVTLVRKTMKCLMDGSVSALYGDDDDGAAAEDKEMDVIDTDEINEVTQQEKQETAEGPDGPDNDQDGDGAKKKLPVWKKPQKKKGGKKHGKKQKSKSKTKTEASQGDGTSQNQDKASDNKGVIADSQTTSVSNKKSSRQRPADEEGGSGSDDSDSNSGSGEEDDDGGGSGGHRRSAHKGKEKEENPQPADEEDDEEEWQRFQKRMNKREKVLEGKSRISHSVHCPYFTDDKQEFWWCYIADRKTHLLITPPNHVTSLVEREEVELKFTAPQKPGHYTFTVCLRSDSYLGLDILQDIKVDVCEAREAPTEHPQWEFEDDSDEQDSAGEDSDDDFATDDDYDEEAD